MPVNINTALFWDVTPYSLVDGYQLFGGTCSIRLQGTDYTASHHRRHNVYSVQYFKG
jgi:hypothetical protein